MKTWLPAFMTLAMGIFSDRIAHAEMMALPVPTHTMFPGQVINEADFAQKTYEVSATAKLNYLVSLEQIRHKQAARTIPAGKPVPLAALAEANDVRKGQETAAHFLDDGIDIQGVLSPLRDGVAGQIVPCRNPSSGLIVEALVMEDGSLSVSRK